MATGHDQRAHRDRSSATGTKRIRKHCDMILPLVVVHVKIWGISGVVTPRLGIGKTVSRCRFLPKIIAHDPRAEAADAQAGGTWDRVPRPDPA